MRSYAAATWATMEAVHTLMLEVIMVSIIVVKIFKTGLIILTITTYKVSTDQDEKPENERERLDPDHWYNNPSSSILSSYIWNPDSRCSAIFAIDTIGTTCHFYPPRSR